MKIKPTVFSVTQVHRIAQYNKPSKSVVFDNRLFTVSNNNILTVLWFYLGNIIKKVLH